MYRYYLEKKDGEKKRNYENNKSQRWYPYNDIIDKVRSSDEHQCRLPEWGTVINIFAFTVSLS